MLPLNKQNIQTQLIINQDENLSSKSLTLSELSIHFTEKIRQYMRDHEKSLIFYITICNFLHYFCEQFLKQFELNFYNQLYETSRFYSNKLNLYFTLFAQTPNSLFLPVLMGYCGDYFNHAIAYKASMLFMIIGIFQFYLALVEGSFQMRMVYSFLFPIGKESFMIFSFCQIRQYFPSTQDFRDKLFTYIKWGFSMPRIIAPIFFIPFYTVKNQQTALNTFYENRAYILSFVFLFMLVDILCISKLIKFQQVLERLQGTHYEKTNLLVIVKQYLSKLDFVVVMIVGCAVIGLVNTDFINKFDVSFLNITRGEKVTDLDVNTSSISIGKLSKLIQYLICFLFKIVKEISYFIWITFLQQLNKKKITNQQLNQYFWYGGAFCFLFYAGILTAHIGTNQKTSNILLFILNILIGMAFSTASTSVQTLILQFLIDKMPGTAYGLLSSFSSLFNTITLVSVNFVQNPTQINYLLAFGLLSSFLILLASLIVVRNINEKIMKMQFNKEESDGSQYKTP